MSWLKTTVKQKFTFNKMFEKKIKIESLSAIVDKKADEVSAEQIAAINTELQAAGISGIEVSVAGTISGLQETITEKDSAISTANADLKKANETVAELQTKLGAAPAAETEEIQVEKDKIKDEKESKEFNFDESPSAKVLNKFF